MRNVYRRRERCFTYSLRVLSSALFLCSSLLLACGQAPVFPLVDTDDEDAFDALTTPAQWAETLSRCGTYTLGTEPPLHTCVVPDARVLDFGRLVYQGEIDITACVSRIAAGSRLNYRHDGTVFRNNERKLPREGSGYYHEYVDPTPGVSGPGPQRIVHGSAHEWWYTPDHYVTFYHVDCTL
jgi:guanyl-specific ribonuclease Sa